MNKMMRVFILGGLFLGLSSGVFISPAQDARANALLPEACLQGWLATHDPKYPAEQLTLVCIPDVWNGQLVIYAHGYTAPQLPLALPVADLTLPDGSTVPGILLGQGFAFATSSYHKNGYAVEQAVDDLKFLVKHFKTLVPPDSLQKVWVVGASEGGLITAMLIEKFPGKYDGGLALCGPVAGGPDQVQYLGDFRAVFDYFFPGVFTFPPGLPGEQPFGVVDVPEEAYLFWDVYIDRVAAAIQNDFFTNNGAKVSQLLSVTGAAIDPLDPTTIGTTAVSVLFYSIFGTNDLIATAGGVPYENQATIYTGSLDDESLNAGIERVEADPRAEAYIRRFYLTRGELEQPLVTLHNTLDGAVPFQHELVYQQRVSLAGSSNFLTVIPAPRYGHCNFATGEILSAFEMLVRE